MAKGSVNTRRITEDIVRLRRIIRAAGESLRPDIEAVLTDLEEMIGPSITRAEAARLLRISRPALDRWIAKGDIPTVVTPSGRTEVPLSPILDLIERREGTGTGSLTLAQVIRDQRRDAASIPEDLFLPPKRRPRTHKVPDLHALAYHRLVSSRLDDRAVANARKRLEQWEQNGRIDPRWAGEWKRILAMPLGKIAQIITADSERGRALRQSSPFAGVLNEHERRRVAQAVEERVAR